MVAAIQGVSAERRAAAQARVGAAITPQWQLQELLTLTEVSDIYLCSATGGQRASMAVLPQSLADQPDVRLAFIAAARLPALEHPGLVDALADGETPDGLPFMLSQLLEGESCARLAERRPGRIPPAEALRIVGEVLKILEALHLHGRPHGALSARRVFLTPDGQVRVMGAGSWQLRLAVARAQGRPFLEEALEYAPPEQLEGQLPTALGDLWSAGALLALLLVGQPVRPPGGAAPWAVRSLAQLAPEAPPSLVALVDRALAPSPAQRFQSAEELARTVARVGREPAIQEARGLATARGARRALAEHAELQPRLMTPTVPAFEAEGRTPRSAPPRPRSAAPSPAGGALRPTPTSMGVRRDSSPHRPTVPELRAVESTEVSQAELEELTVIVELMEAVLARYEENGPRHALTRGALAKLYGRTALALVASPGGLTFAVEADGLFAGPHPLTRPGSPLAKAVRRLYADGLRLLGLRPAVTEAELLALVGWLRAAHDASWERGQDSVVALAWAKLSHVFYRAVERPEALFPDALRQSRELLAVLDVDTSLQLQEAWVQGHAQPPRSGAREPLAYVLEVDASVRRRASASSGSLPPERESAPPSVSGARSQRERIAQRILTDVQVIESHFYINLTESYLGAMALGRSELVLDALHLTLARLLPLGVVEPLALIADCGERLEQQTGQPVVAQRFVARAWSPKLCGTLAGMVGSATGEPLLEAWCALGAALQSEAPLAIAPELLQQLSTKDQARLRFTARHLHLPWGAA